MAVPPKYAAHKLRFRAPASGEAAPGLSSSMHTLEVYLDYVCPFSAKQFNTLYHMVVPLVQGSAEWSAGLEIIFRHQVQPWHPSSTLTHEAAVAVLKVAPESVVNEPRNQTYKRLAKVAAGVGVDEAKVYELLEISDKPGPDGSLNSGNQVTNDLKVLIKMARLVSIHVSPTVVYDGLVANDISSSWTKEQWTEFLTKNVV
ncbi:hypothetical protein PG997_009397 [Apiospora hydei]|uniref:Thioredoxin-like fold domain-containing protein n=1 Tax=Apiospora hydei TaxID=1337664 RepID=A0ABR1VXV9_9PEZI